MSTTSRERYRDALAIPEFRAIFGAHVVSMTGTIVAEFSTAVLVYRQTASPLLTTLVFTLAFTPHLFAGTLFSSLVDRVPVRRLLVGCNLATAALAATMAIPGVPVPVLLLLVFTMGMVAPIFAGARAATLPQVLPDHAYVPGRSLLRLVAQGSQVWGLAAGGLLLTVLSPSHGLVLQSAAFLLSAAVLRFLTSERRAPGSSGSLIADSLDGLRAVLAIPPVRRVLLLSWAIPALSLFPEALAVPYASQQGFSTIELGLMMAVLPLGNVLGEFLGMWCLTPARQIRLILPLAALVFVPLLGWGFAPGSVAAMAILLLSGLGFAHHLGLDHQLIDTVPESLRSRALALQTFGLMFWQGVGFALAGALGQAAPITLVVAASAVAGLLVILALSARTGGTQKPGPRWGP